MKRILYTLLLSIVALAAAAAEAPFTVERVAANGHGLKGRFPDGKRLVIVAGSPEEMGSATGELCAAEIAQMGSRILVAAAGYAVGKDDWFFTRIDEVMQRTLPYTPERFLVECDAMSRSAGIREREGRHLNFFPEMFHCSGIAVRGQASAGGEIIHARVLDYMRDLGLYDLATVQIFLPDDHYAWASVGYAGFIGTVTAMNEHGLAMGEMGGAGYGDWDGIPMSFLMRRIMEECRTVAEAVKLLKETPLTCEYYYILSDPAGDLAAVSARAGENGELSFYAPGDQNPRLPKVPEDTVFISNGDRAVKLQERLMANYGSITPEIMIEMIKPPVAMNSNLHNAIFVPRRGDIYFADASKEKTAADMPYTRFNVPAVIQSYRQVMAAHQEVKP